MSTKEVTLSGTSGTESFISLTTSSVSNPSTSGSNSNPVSTIQGIANQQVLLNTENKDSVGSSRHHSWAMIRKSKERKKENRMLIDSYVVPTTSTPESQEVKEESIDVDQGKNTLRSRKLKARPSLSSIHLAVPAGLAKSSSLMENQEVKKENRKSLRRSKELPLLPSSSEIIRNDAAPIKTRRRAFTERDPSKNSLELARIRAQTIQPDAIQSVEAESNPEIRRQKFRSLSVFGQNGLHSAEGVKKQGELERKIEKRINIKNQLKYLHKCLKTVLIKRNLTLYLKEEGWLHYHPKAEDSHKNTDNIINYIYLIINRALFEESYFYFDCDGNVFSIIDLDKMISALYPEANKTHIVRKEIKKIIDEKKVIINRTFNDLYKVECENEKQEITEVLCQGEVDYIHYLKDLSLPAQDLELFSERKRVYCQALQKLHPLQNSTHDSDFFIVSPKMFLFSCIKELKGEEFFEYCEYLLSLSNFYMPYRQKIILLNFCKLFVLNINGVQKNNFRFHSSNKINKDQDFFITSLCEEVDLLLKGIDTKELKINKKKPVDMIFERLKLGLFPSVQLNEYIDEIADDLKMVALSTFSNFNIQACATMEKNNGCEPVTYFNLVIDYVASSFLSLLKKHMPEGKPIKGNELVLMKADFFNLYSTFLRIGMASFKHHDYLSTIAIFLGIGSSKIERIIKDAPKSTEFNKMIEQKKKICSPSESFGYIRKKIKKCQLNKVLYVPHIAAWVTLIQHELDSVDIYAQNNAFSRLKAFSTYLHDVEENGHKKTLVELQEYLEDLKIQMDLASSEFCYETTIAYQIYQSTQVKEEESERYYSLVS